MHVDDKLATKSQVIRPVVVVDAELKPGFHPNAICYVACVAFGWKPGLSSASTTTTGLMTCDFVASLSSTCTKTH